jgi:hypothetical protein
MFWKNSTNDTKNIAKAKPMDININYPTFAGHCFKRYTHVILFHQGKKGRAD